MRHYYNSGTSVAFLGVTYWQLQGSRYLFSKNGRVILFDHGSYREVKPTSRIPAFPKTTCSTMRVVYEMFNRQLEGGERVRAIDGNPLNFSIDNLKVVSNGTKKESLPGSSIYGRRGPDRDYGSDVPRADGRKSSRGYAGDSSDDDDGSDKGAGRAYTAKESDCN